MSGARWSWTMHKPGHWSAHGYEIKRDRPGHGWRILRDGKYWDNIPTLPAAKQACVSDCTRAKPIDRTTMNPSTDFHDPGDEDRSVDAYCRNCGDPFDADAESAAIRQPSGAWRPCPKPSPGRPMLDCGVGGHMYDEREPRCS